MTDSIKLILILIFIIQAVIFILLQWLIYKNKILKLENDSLNFSKNMLQIRLKRQESWTKWHRNIGKYYIKKYTKLKRQKTNKKLKIYLKLLYLLEKHDKNN